nr:hypothetical protein Iba_chr12aCG6330 [Ipomoea batatas]
MVLAVLDQTAFQGKSLSCPVCIFFSSLFRFPDVGNLLSMFPLNWEKGCGVSDSFQVFMPGGYRSPLTAEAMHSSSEVSLAESDGERSETETHTYLAKEDFIGVGAIHIGGVEQGDAGINGVVNELDHIFIRLGRAVKTGHPHTAKTLRRYFQPLRTQLDPRHICCHCSLITMQTSLTVFGAVASKDGVIVGSGEFEQPNIKRPPSPPALKGGHGGN